MSRIVAGKKGNSKFVRTSERDVHGYDRPRLLAGATYEFKGLRPYEVVGTYAQGEPESPGQSKTKKEVVRVCTGMLSGNVGRVPSWPEAICAAGMRLILSSRGEIATMLNI